MRICRKFPLDLRYRSKALFGLGIQDLYVEQGVDKVAYYVEERLSNRPSGPLLRANYETTLLHIGVEYKSIFDLEYTL